MPPFETPPLPTVDRPPRDARLGREPPCRCSLIRPALGDRLGWRVLHCGIDLSPFDREFVDRDRVRGELGIQNDAFVVGHVGRFHVQKNHAFLLDVAAEAARIEPRFRLLLVGKGELRAAVEAKAMRLGLLNRVTFAGSRGDVPRLMLGAMDAFVLPSLFEGLPIVGIKAQASGLPIVLSDAITPEIDIIPHLVKRLPLGAPAAEWAKALLRKDESGTARPANRTSGHPGQLLQHRIRRRGAGAGLSRVPANCWGPGHIAFIDGRQVWFIKHQFGSRSPVDADALASTTEEGTALSRSRSPRYSARRASQTSC